MSKQKFKLIGHQIKNSASPFIHNKIFSYKQTQNFQSYEIADIKPNEFYSTFSKLNNLVGANITTPYKIKTFNQLKLKSKIASKYGCVNTIKTLPNGELKGFNTDGFGFLKSLQSFNTNFFKNVLILGFGGAGQVAAHCLENKCKNLFIAIRNFQKIPQKWFKTKAQFVKLNESGSLTKPKQLNFQLIVNATTCGNWNNPNSSAIDLDTIGKVDAVFDLIYYPTQTKLLKKANELGASTLNGVNMLVWQAVAAQQIWNGFVFQPSFITSLIKKTAYFLENKMLNPNL